MSSFHPDTGGRRWSLVQVRLFSGAAGREEPCRQMSLACVGSTHSVPATLGLPPLTGMCSPRLYCSGSRLGEWALRGVRFQFSGSPQKRGLRCACVLCLPCRRSSGIQELDGRALPGCGAPSPLRGPSLSFRAPVDCVCLVCVLGGWPLAVTLPRDVNHPESQEVFG